MANPYKNKVIIGGETILDLTSDTVTENYLALGITAHDKSGQLITGTIPDGDVLGYGTPSSSMAGVGQAGSMVVDGAKTPFTNVAKTDSGYLLLH